ncbi:MAG TPA: serine hydrolase domain-containing protein, partial [Chitinophagaceae bacterium]|nr:serine hydrolase domain-containing protein [Chitinophagaceae bacterium]
MKYIVLVVVPLYLFIPGCQPKDADEGNYKYSTASWQGTHVYSDRFELAILKSRRLITEANRLSGLPGAQLAVAVDGKICWSENFGFSDLQQGSPVTANTIFRTASVSKLFTACAVAKLIQEGKLNLDTPVIRYLPELPAHYANITIRHLVSHQSGIRHYFGADLPAKEEHYADVNDALQLFVQAPLLFPPGKDCEYSSYGWVLISAVIQRVSGKPFLRYMQSEVWDAMELKNTFAEIPEARLKDLTRFYKKTSPQGSWKKAEYQDLSFNWGAAGFSSNANDLAVFGNALLNGKFLNKETVKLMFAPQLTGKGDTTGFGIGFTLYQSTNQQKIIGHGGFMPTARSYLFLFPGSNLVIAFTSNSAMTNFSDENLVAIAENFINENADETYFRFNPELNHFWTGLWRVEIENDDGQQEEAFFHFYEDKNELKGTYLSANAEPKQVEITELNDDSISFLAMLP